MSRISGILLAVVAISACGPAREASEMLPPVLDTVTVAQARRAADELGADLVTMLTSEDIWRSGAVKLVELCLRNSTYCASPLTDGSPSARAIGTPSSTARCCARAPSRVGLVW